MINLNLIIISLELKNKNSLNYHHLIKNRDKIRFLYIFLNTGFFFILLSSVFKVFNGFFPLLEWFYLFSLMLWFLMFPTFIVQGKEIVIFELKTNEISNNLRSKVSQMSLLVLINLFFQSAKKNYLIRFFVVVLKQKHN